MNFIPCSFAEGTSESTANGLENSGSVRCRFDMAVTSARRSDVGHNPAGGQRAVHKKRRTQHAVKNIRSRVHTRARARTHTSGSGACLCALSVTPSLISLSLTLYVSTYRIYVELSVCP